MPRAHDRSVMLSATILTSMLPLLWIAIPVNLTRAEEPRATVCFRLLDVPSGELTPAMVCIRNLDDKTVRLPPDGRVLHQVNRLEEAQKQYQLERFLKQLDKLDLLICDEFGYLSFNRSGAELLFQVFADRYERARMLITSNLPFSEWQQVFQGERMTAALLDRLTHHCEIFEMNGESYRFRESMKGKQTEQGKSS